MPDACFVTDLAAHKGPFFQVLHTTTRSQTAFMTVPAGAEAGPTETHPQADQVFYVVGGEAEFTVHEDQGQAPTVHRGGPGTVVVVAAGVAHHVRSIGNVPLFFLTVYAPPEY